MAKRRSIGGYKILETLGSGGMANVHLALQPTLERYVAIKELKAEAMAHTGVAERFEREAQSMAALAHQNIVHIYDYWLKPQGAFIVMEYVEGIDLRSLLDRIGIIEPTAAVIIGAQIARALEYAHFRGVVHRDLKPSNVMVNTLGELKLMDFGVAKDEAFKDLTHTGQALGTPSYMSPEQILGKDIDFRSDIFSFGVLMYELLVGRKPFHNVETVAVVHQILKEQPDKPKLANPKVPTALQDLVLRCLQKKPAKRYASTSVLRHELEMLAARQVHVDQTGYLIDYLEAHGILTPTDAEPEPESPSSGKLSDDARIGNYTQSHGGSVFGWTLLFGAIGIAILVAVAWYGGLPTGPSFEFASQQ